MKIIIHEFQSRNAAEIISEDIVIKETQDAIDLLGECDYKGARSLQDFIRESNRGNRIFFLSDFETALNRLKQ